jgi:hypothetical protein
MAADGFAFEDKTIDVQPISLVDMALAINVPAKLTTFMAKQFTFTEKVFYFMVKQY